jgi:hypothetical protein
MLLMFTVQITRSRSADNEKSERLRVRITELEARKTQLVSERLAWHHMCDDVDWQGHAASARR